METKDIAKELRRMDKLIDDAKSMKNNFLSSVNKHFDGEFEKSMLKHCKKYDTIVLKKPYKITLKSKLIGAASKTKSIIGFDTEMGCVVFYNDSRHKYRNLWSDLSDFDVEDRERIVNFISSLKKQDIKKICDFTYFTKGHDDVELD